MNDKIRIGGGKSYVTPAIEIVKIQSQKGYAASVNLDGGWNDNTNELNFGS